MNAQSTPVRQKKVKTQLVDSFAELTPIKDCTSHYIEIANVSDDFICSQKSEKFPVSLTKSQRTRIKKKRKEAERRKLMKRLYNCDDRKVNNNCTLKELDTSTSNHINELSTDFFSEIKDLFKESFVGDMGYSSASERVSASITNNSFVTSGITKTPNEKHSQNSGHQTKIQKLDHTSVKEEVLSKESQKINEILTVSDVMKWSYESLVPKESNVNLSNQIKQKLLENVTIKEVPQSQHTGWTQLNCSAILKSEKTLIYNELGDFYGLPTKVQKLYEDHKGIKELYKWQQECLNMNAVKMHSNLVYALPTSGGKTLVAELLILRELLCYNRNVLFILPYVSIVQEKIRDFSHFALELGFLVEEYAAGKGAIPPRKRRRRNSLIIATIEKALIVVNSLIETNRLHEFGLLVVDELHMLSEDGRGAILETLLTQVLYRKEKIQIIGMTATIGNLMEVAQFLNAESYVGDFRPVSLHEYIKCENKIYEIDWKSENAVKEVRTLTSSKQGMDPDGIAALVQEVIPNDSALVFCPTRKNCENVALLLSQVLYRNLMKHKEEEKKSLYRALLSESNDQICPILRKTLPFGVAYHHSGLTAGERKLLEESFRDGTLSVICCTSTLAVGVNLPAKRVILRSPYVGKDFINLSRYKQMVGRAGRSGFGSEGESFLVCQKMDLEKVKKLLHSQMDETTSKIDFDSCKELILCSIGLGTATTRKTLRELVSCSLLHSQSAKLNVDTKKMTDTCISNLYKQGALRVKDVSVQSSQDASCSRLDLNTTATKKSLKLSNDSQLMISRLGRAAMKGGLSLEKAHDLYGDLIKAQSSLVLLTNLHLLYLVTPSEIFSQIKPNFSLYFNAYLQLSSNEIHTANIIGITEFVMTKLAMGHQPKCVSESVVSRFYVSLMLNLLWKQRTVWEVANMFQLPRGQVQTLMTSAATYANCVLRFCEELEEFWSFKSLLTDFCPQLAHCCSAELLPLMDLPAVKRGRAKQLYEAGYKTLHILAVTEPNNLVQTIDHLSLRVASQIVAAAKLLLMEKAENLKEEAEDVLEGLAAQSAPKQI
ncbi:hypothetical protein RUM43_002469 [Polyplax serrata]|uniref:Helicase POLQ-like n=1 Tax=Polyplax serrata TaxID=468196 RepID=A0AAN8NYV6_POLSC